MASSNLIRNDEAFRMSKARMDEVNRRVRVRPKTPTPGAVTWDSKLQAWVKVDG